MRALQFSEFGPPDKLQCRDVPDPILADGQALVQIRAASINPSDVKNVEGRMGGTTLPRIPGRDFSGTVVGGSPEWLGKDVWGGSGEIGFTLDGSHAELMAIDVSALTPKPSSCSHEQTATLGVTFVIGWLGLVEYANLRRGETVAVIGAGGGVGTAVVQIAKSFECRVIGIDLHEPDPDTPAGRRIDAFVDSKSDVAQAVREFTGGQGADVVYDAVGGVMFEAATRSLAHRGRLVEISATGKRRVDFDLIDFYHNESLLFGADSRKLSGNQTASILAEVTRKFEDGSFVPPVIARRFSLEEGIEAYTLVREGTNGRIVLLP